LEYHCTGTFAGSTLDEEEGKPEALGFRVHGRIRGIVAEPNGSR